MVNLSKGLKEQGQNDKTCLHFMHLYESVTLGLRHFGLSYEADYCP